MALIHQIEEAEYEIAQLQAVVHKWQQQLMHLRLQRSQCRHVFASALKGHEHEGGTCTVCGINEVHARSNNIGIC